MSAREDRFSPTLRTMRDCAKGFQSGFETLLREGGRSRFFDERMRRGLVAKVWRGDRQSELCGGLRRGDRCAVERAAEKTVGRFPVELRASILQIGARALSPCKSMEDRP